MIVNEHDSVIWDEHIWFDKCDMNDSEHECEVIICLIVKRKYEVSMWIIVKHECEMIIWLIVKRECEVIMWIIMKHKRDVVYKNDREW